MLDRIIAAAERGDADAQNQLGVMYYRGEGVVQDRCKSADWFRKAAEQGHPKAQGSLGIMYTRA